MRIIRIVCFIVMGLAVIPFGVSAFLPVNGSPAYWASFGSLLVASGLGAGFTFLPDKKTTISEEKKDDNIMSENTKNNDKIIEVEPTQTELQAKDIKALYYLSERCSKLGDKTALDICRELQDRIYCLHHSIKIQEDVNDEKTNPSPSTNPST